MCLVNADSVDTASNHFFEYINEGRGTDLNLKRRAARRLIQAACPGVN